MSSTLSSCLYNSSHIVLSDSVSYLLTAVVVKWAREWMKRGSSASKNQAENDWNKTYSQPFKLWVNVAGLHSARFLPLCSACVCLCSSALPSVKQTHSAALNDRGRQRCNLWLHFSLTTDLTSCTLLLATHPLPKGRYPEMTRTQ